LLIVAAAYLFGVQKLQASPSMIGTDPTPYTVQVAVYDIKNRADQTLVFLGNLGYEPFLVDAPRKDGRSRYRVYMGTFVTKEEADLARARLEGDSRFKDFKDAFVRLK
jgi:cell division protein FtsN